jgi:TRAP-type C4-dicarboxylate transport system permease small subunit
MKTAIIRISDGLDWACRTGAGVCFIAMLAFVAIQVVARYLLQSPPTWTEELARYAMVWGGLLGATMAFKTHFDPTLIKAPMGKSRTVMLGASLLRTAAVIIFMTPVLYYSLFGPNMTPARGFLGRSLLRTADTLGFPMIFIAAAVPIAATVILIHLAARIVSGDISDSDGNDVDIEDT